MSIRLKLIREQIYPRRVKYTGDGYFIHDMFFDQVALKQAFHGELPDELLIIIETPDDESDMDRLARETDNDLRKNAWRLT